VPCVVCLKTLFVGTGIINLISYRLTIFHEVHWTASIGLHMKELIWTIKVLLMLPRFDRQKSSTSESVIRSIIIKMTKSRSAQVHSWVQMHFIFSNCSISLCFYIFLSGWWLVKSALYWHSVNCWIHIELSYQHITV